METEETRVMPDSTRVRTQDDLVEVLAWFTRRWEETVDPRTGRIRGKLTQAALAKAMNVSPQSLSAFKKGSRRLPLDAFHDALRALGASNAEIRRWLDGWRRVFERPTRTSPVPHQLPLVVSEFVGRTDHLERLDELLTARGTVPVAVITGTAGVGKTALALFWAHRVRDRFPDGDLYVNLRGFDDDARPLTPADVLGGLLRDLGVPADEIRAQTEDRARQFRTVTAGKQLLMLLDNAVSAAQVRPLLPGTHGCTVLVTSRNELTDLVAVVGARSHPLDTLPAADSVSLLRTMVGGRADREAQVLTWLARLCCHLPLALRIAGARVARSPLPITAAVHRLHRDQLDFFDDTHSITVRAVFSWSYRLLSAEQATVFRLLGMHQGPDLSTEAVAALACLPVDQAGQVLRHLASAHLVEPHHEGGRWRMHDLLRVYAAEQCTVEERRAALARLVSWYLAHAKAADGLLAPGDGAASEIFTDREQAERWFQAERSNLMASIRSALGCGFRDAFRELSDSLAEFLDLRTQWSEWETIAEDALAEARAHGDHRTEAWLLNQLGYVYSDQRDNERAVAAFSAALAADRFVGDPVNQVTALTGQAIVHRITGRCEEAIHLCRRGLKIATEARLPLAEARLLQNLGCALGRLGRFAEQVEHARRGLAIRWRLGHETGVADSLTELAAAHHGLGRHRAGVACARAAITRWRREGHGVGEARALVQLAAGLGACGRLDEAIEACTRAVTLARDRDHAHTVAQALTELGELRHRNGDGAIAAALLSEAVTVQEAVGDRPGLDRASALLDLVAATDHR